MGAAWAQHAMCESALSVCHTVKDLTLHIIGLLFTASETAVAIGKPDYYYVVLCFFILIWPSFHLLAYSVRFITRGESG
jgi:hypothetical protein